MENIVHGATQVLEQRLGVRLWVRSPRCDGKHNPVISDAVEEAVAVAHHGSHSTQDCGVADQTGRQHEVATAAALSIEGIHKEIWRGKSFLLADQIKPKEMSVKTFSILGFSHQCVVLVKGQQQGFPPGIGAASGVPHGLTPVYSFLGTGSHGLSPAVVEPASRCCLITAGRPSMHSVVG